MKFRILVLGGYGNFGARIVRTLAEDADLELIVAGRRLSAAQTLVNQLRANGARAQLSAGAIDIDAADMNAHIADFSPALVIHTCGPFQGRDYRVAQAALNVAAHYVDLADARDFVGGIEALDRSARERARLVVSGASSVPGLSCAVVDRYAAQFRRLTRIAIGISPGNQTARGPATVAAILSYVGRPISAWRNGRSAQGYGWQSLRRHRYPEPIGLRWLAACDVPDLSLLPRRFADLERVEFRAGLELRRMHFGLYLLSYAVRVGLIRRLDACTAPLLWLADRWRNLGSAAGAMHVDLCGETADRGPARLRWTLIAENGDGPQVPCAAAVVLARKLARGKLSVSGAQPCVGLFSLQDILDALAGHAIRTQCEWTSF